MTARETVLAAFALASSGHPDEAKALLRDSPALETEEGLDLLARIELSLGNETEARRLWTRADGSRARRALEALDLTEWRYHRLVRFIRLLTEVVLVFLLVNVFTKLFC